MDIWDCNEYLHLVNINVSVNSNWSNLKNTLLTSYHTISKLLASYALNKQNLNFIFENEYIQIKTIRYLLQYINFFNCKKKVGEKISKEFPLYSERASYMY